MTPPAILSAARKTAEPGFETEVKAIVGEKLSVEAFSQLAGHLAGYPFIKLVVDKSKSTIHFLNHRVYAFHADYIAETFLGISSAEMNAKIDVHNKSFYNDPDRNFYLGILALHRRGERRFFSLETVEVDTMDLPMLEYFYKFVRDQVDPSIPVLLKPANHAQENMLTGPEGEQIPHILSHELFETAEYIPLNRGSADGRLRAFRTHEDYKRARATIEWHDIIVMPRVPDDIPRLSGIINAEHTTPLSHTNVLASGWQIPNAIQLGIFDQIDKQKLDGQWVKYSVSPDAAHIELQKIDRPENFNQAPSWKATKITLETPEISSVPIVLLEDLRVSDRFRYGTKAANLGEINHIISRKSEKLLGYYRVPRPPRKNLLPYLATALGVAETANLNLAAWDYLRKVIHLPRGIAIPFSFQQRFLESSPPIQQAIGKLKMALELNAPNVDALCVSLQKMITGTRLPDTLRDEIDSKIAEHLGGVSTFVVRSSSNAEDLQNFSAAGIYESVNHVTTADKIFSSIKEVWSSIVSPRSVRLRQDVGILLEDVYMGVIVQEEMPSKFGGVMVTTNPANRADFRNVYMNISQKSVISVVQGSDLPIQYLFNTVEGGGRTLSLGSATTDLSSEQRKTLQKLAFVGRLLQSHFSPDYTFSTPMDIEWLANEEGIYVLQLRPYSS